MRAFWTSRSWSASRSISRSRRRSLSPCSRPSSSPRTSRTRSSARADSLATRSRELSASASSRSQSSELVLERLPPRHRLLAAGLGRLDPLAQLDLVGLQPAALVLRGDEALAKGGPSRARLGRVGVGGLRGRARFRDGRGEGGEPPASLLALRLHGVEGLLDLGQPHRGRALLLLRLAALRVQDDGLAREAGELLLGGAELVADGHQVFVGGVDTLFEGLHLAGRGLRPRVLLRGRGAAGEESLLQHFLPLRAFPDLPPRRQQPLHPPSALHHRARAGSPRRGWRKRPGRGAPRCGARPRGSPPRARRAGKRGCGRRGAPVTR